MKRQVIFRSFWAMPASLLILFSLVGCQPSAPTLPPQDTPMPESASTQAPASPSPESSMPMPTSQPGTDSMSTPMSQPDTSLTPTTMAMAMSPQPCLDSTPMSMPTSQPLYQDDFKNPDSGWPQKVQFDNYSIGYHEPDWYHIEITTANQTAPVFLPKKSFGDATIESQVFANSKRTAPTGDLRYGLAFRRSGDLYYAFAISPRSKKWYVLKRSPSEVVSLKEGSDSSIHDLDATDELRVDAQGSNFSFYINGHLVSQVTDSDYQNGEIGLYAETIDSPRVHVHFDGLNIRNVEAPINGEPALYQDDFTNPCTGWPIKTFDNYYIGYHEPQWYYVEIKSPNSIIPIINPTAKSFGDDITTELQVFTDSPNTSTEGGFRYGLVFRRSGDNYYAFAISPRTKQWYVLKHSPQGMEVLKDGSEESIKGLDKADLLRVDSQGPNFFFHINDNLVGQITDSAYKSGDVGLYTETIDSPFVRIHFDELMIRELALEYSCSITGGTVNVRSGPGTKYPQIGLLSNGDTVKALGRGPNQWIEVEVEGSDKPGWASYSDGYMSCTPAVDLFPVVTP